MAEAPSPSTCANCGAALSGPYCASCGQVVRNPDPELRDFLRDSTQELLSWDGKIPGTLKALFLKPGALTKDFLQGRRARWLHPLRVYLICSLAYFAMGPIGERILTTTSGGGVTVGVRTNAGVIITPEDSAEIMNSSLAARIGQEKMSKLIKDPRGIQSQMNAMVPRSMFLLLPLLALLTNLAFRGTAPRYPAHLYFALHLHAAAFGALMLGKAASFLGLNPVSLIANIAALAYIIWWGLRAFRTVFGGSWAAITIKGIVIGAVYTALNAATSMVLFVYSLS